MEKTYLNRFLKSFKINNENQCWEWTATKTKGGYGSFYMNGKNLRAHRVSYSHYVGQIKEKFLICHKCDNRICVNPDHLFMGTYGDNNRDCSAKKRTFWQKKTHCINGHEFNEKNTKIRKSPSDQAPVRVCKKCKNIETNKRRKRLRLKRRSLMESNHLRLTPSSS